jgi:hypothetical protein
MKQAVLIGAVSAALLAGCVTHGEAPAPVHFGTSEQLKLTAADHWRRIAIDFGTQLGEDLKQKGANAPIFVEMNVKGEIPFVEGFREVLTTALVRLGWDVRTKPGDGVLNASVRYSVYSFQKYREHLYAIDISGKNTSDDVPQTEVLVTAAVTKGDQVVTRYSEIYYAADEDAALYWNSYRGRRGTPTLMPVKGGE